MQRARTPHVVIIRDAVDLGASAVAREIQALARDLTVSCLTPLDLVLGRWQHEIDAGGRARTRIVAGRSALDDAEIGAAWYRARSLPVPQFARATEADRNYAALELGATIVSWLQALGDRVINRPCGASPLGPLWSEARWLATARHAGLAIESRTLGSSPRSARAERAVPEALAEPLSVVAGRAMGYFGTTWAQELASLGAATGCAFLQLRIANEKVTAIDPVGEITGQNDIQRCAALLVQRARAAAAKASAA